MAADEETVKLYSLSLFLHLYSYWETEQVRQLGGPAINPFINEC